MGKVEVSRDTILEAMVQPAVTKQLRVIADRVERRAQQLAGNEGVELETRVEESVRPGGRPQAVVWGDNGEQEFGSSRTERRRILGRAAEDAR